MTTRGRRARIPRVGINPIRESCSCATGAFHGQEIPSKSKQTGGGPTLAFATYDFERDGVLFIGTFAAAHGEARAESRSFPCA